MGATIKIAILAQAAKAKAEMSSLADKAKGLGSEMSGALGLSVGAGIGGALVTGISGALGKADLTAKLQTQLGTSKEEAGRLGDVAGKLYAGNFGDSMGQVGDALVSVQRNLGSFATNASGGIEGVTQKALTLSTTFDQDLGGTTAAVGQLLKTGLAANADEAFDIITKGFQSGADKAGDLLDTFNEYGTQFRKLGVDGQTATGLLSQGLKAGARDADVVADALKEFSIRAVDGSKTTADGFKSLGLSGKQMAADIAGGGPKASKALDTVLDRLRGVKDPVERSRIAVELFGTQAEDLGDALYALDPSTAVAGLGQVSGAAQRAVDTMGETPSAKIEAFKRSLTTGFTNAAGALAGFATANSSWLVPLLGTLGGIAAVIWAVNAATTAWKATQTAIVAVTEAWKAVQLALNASFLANPVFLVIAAIVALVAIIVIAYKNSETFRAIVQAVWAAIQAAVSAVVNWFVTNIPKLWTAAQAVWSAIQTAASAVWNAIKAVIGLVIAGITLYINTYKAVVVAVWNAISAAASAVWNAIKAVISAVIAAITAYINAYRTAAAAVWNAVSSAASSAWNGIKNAISTVINGIKTTLTGLVTTVKSAFSNAGSLLEGAGRAIVQGLINGIKNMAGAAVNAAKGVVSDALTGAKRLLGIASPSKEFRKVGQYSGEGLALGLSDMGGDVRKAAESMVSIPSAAAARIDTAGRIDVTKAAGGSTAPVVSLTFDASGDPLMDAIWEQLRKRVRVSGGSVQLALGRG